MKILKNQTNTFRKKSKEELYIERLGDKNHNEILFVENIFFKTKDQLSEIRNVARAFNSIVERETKTIFYSVTLRYGITKIAADFYYQYKIFQKYAKDHGLFPEIQEELISIDAELLVKSITWKEALGRFTLPKTFFEETKNLSTTQKTLLILYKAYSNQPNRDPRFWENAGGVTGLSDSRAASLLGCSRKTISIHRNTLEKKGYVRTYYFDGRYRKMRLTI